MQSDELAKCDREWQQARKRTMGFGCQLVPYTQCTNNGCAHCGSELGFGELFAVWSVDLSTWVVFCGYCNYPTRNGDTAQMAIICERIQVATAHELSKQPPMVERYLQALRNVR